MFHLKGYTTAMNTASICNFKTSLSLECVVSLSNILQIHVNVYYVFINNISLFSQKQMHFSCADPESFARGVQP